MKVQLYSHNEDDALFRTLGDGTSGNCLGKRLRRCRPTCIFNKIATQDKRAICQMDQEAIIESQNSFNLYVTRHSETSGQQCQ